MQKMDIYLLTHILFLFQKNGNPFVNEEKRTNEWTKNIYIYIFNMLRTQKILNSSHVASECFGVLLLHGILSIYHFIHTQSFSLSNFSPSTFPLSWLSCFCCRLLVAVVANWISNQRRSAEYLRFHTVYRRQIVLSPSWLCVLHSKTAKTLE